MVNGCLCSGFKGHTNRSKPRMLKSRDGDGHPRTELMATQRKLAPARFHPPQSEARQMWCIVLSGIQETAIRTLECRYRPPLPRGTTL